jgi:hypothetical protein
MPARDGSSLSLQVKSEDKAFKDFRAAVVALIDQYFPYGKD